MLDSDLEKTMTDVKPIFDAAARADLSQLAELLDAGADPNAVNPIIGNSVLYNACFADQVEVVNLLLAHGADPNKRLVYRSPVDGRVEEDVVALMFANSEAVAAALLAAGADVNAQDQQGRTPLMRTVLAGTVAQVRLLIASGADVSARDRLGRTAADSVRTRLKWLRDNLPLLKEKEAKALIEQREEVLGILGGDT
jgi:ankyrin repeat protein